MPHLPFEEWLFWEETLPAVQQQALQDHLRECPACRLLAKRRDESEAELRAMALAPAPQGFLERWVRIRQLREAQSKLWHAWLALALCAAGALILAAMLGTLLAALVPSPVRLATDLVHWAFSLASQLSAAEVLASVLLQGARDLVPPPLWAGLLLTLGLLCALWVRVLLRLNAQGVQA